IRMLAEPAVLMSAPNTSTSAGISNSPPATPSMLLTRPTPMPMTKPAARCADELAGSRPPDGNGSSASAISNSPSAASNIAISPPSPPIGTHQPKARRKYGQAMALFIAVFPLGRSLSRDLPASRRLPRHRLGFGLGLGFRCDSLADLAERFRLWAERAAHRRR